jgi:hypothetical protein
MKQEYDIWNEVLETLGFKFQEEYTMWRTSNLLIYKKDNKTAKLYLDFDSGIITSFSILNDKNNTIQRKEDFQNENKEVLRSIKLKYLLDSIS